MVQLAYRLSHLNGFLVFTVTQGGEVDESIQLTGGVVVILSYRYDPIEGLVVQNVVVLAVLLDKFVNAALTLLVFELILRFPVWPFVVKILVLNIWFVLGLLTRIIVLRLSVAMVGGVFVVVTVVVVVL